MDTLTTWDRLHEAPPADRAQTDSWPPWGCSAGGSSPSRTWHVAPSVTPVGFTGHSRSQRGDTSAVAAGITLARSYAARHPGDHARPADRESLCVVTYGNFSVSSRAPPMALPARHPHNEVAGPGCPK